MMSESFTFLRGAGDGVGAGEGGVPGHDRPMTHPCSCTGAPRSRPEISPNTYLTWTHPPRGSILELHFEEARTVHCNA
jgi:hypothetical protein